MVFGDPWGYRGVDQLFMVVTDPGGSAASEFLELSHEETAGESQEDVPRLGEWGQHDSVPDLVDLVAGSGEI
jgi:hypothetical protein